MVEAQAQRNRCTTVHDQTQSTPDLGHSFVSSEPHDLFHQSQRHFSLRYAGTLYVLSCQGLQNHSARRRAAHGAIKHYVSDVQPHDGRPPALLRYPLVLLQQSHERSVTRNARDIRVSISRSPRLASTLSPSRSKVFYLLPTRLLVKPITHSRSGKPMFPQPVQYGFHALKCFSFSIPASSIISSSFSSTIFAFSSMRFGAMDFGMTDTRKCFIRTNHKDQLYDGSMPTGHSEAVRVQGNENI